MAVEVTLAVHRSHVLLFSFMEFAFNGWETIFLATSVVVFERYFLSGVDVNAVDYDGRSALHVAAAEGHTEVICFLLESAGADASLRDR